MQDDTLARLYATIQSKRGGDPASSYTAKLFADGTPKIAQKVGEEAVELIIEALRQRPERLVAESADLLYHLLVLLKARGITLADVEAALAQRTSMSGLEEKASRKRD